MISTARAILRLSLKTAAPAADSSRIISATALARGILSKFRERGLLPSVAGKSPETVGLRCCAAQELRRSAACRTSEIERTSVTSAPPARFRPRLPSPKCSFASSMAPQTLSRRSRLTCAPCLSFRSRAPTCRAKLACFKTPPARTNSTGAPSRASRRAQSAPLSASAAAASATTCRASRSPFAAAAKTVRASAATSCFSAPFTQSITSSGSFNCNARKISSPKAGHRPVRSNSPTAARKACNPMSYPLPRSPRICPHPPTRTIPPLVP